MTQRDLPPPPLDDDAAISTAVANLLADRAESVIDLAHFTKISAASLYRKLGGQAAWKASDIGRVARHFGVLPGDLFAGASHPVAGRRRGSGQAHSQRSRMVSTREYTRRGRSRLVLCPDPISA